MLSLSALFCLSGTGRSPMLSVPELPLALVDDCNNKLFCCYTKDTHSVTINCNTLTKIPYTFRASSTSTPVSQRSMWSYKTCYMLHFVPHSFQIPLHPYYHHSSPHNHAMAYNSQGFPIILATVLNQRSGFPQTLQELPLFILKRCVLF